MNDAIGKYSYSLISISVAVLMSYHTEFSFIKILGNGIKEKKLNSNNLPKYPLTIYRNHLARI